MYVDERFAMEYLVHQSNKGDLSQTQSDSEIGRVIDGDGEDLGLQEEPQAEVEADAPVGSAEHINVHHLTKR